MVYPTEFWNQDDDEEDLICTDLDQDDDDTDLEQDLHD
jgi:hypothetical protein